MAKVATSPIHNLIIENLPAEGGVPYREFISTLPLEDQKEARGQIQVLKLKGVVGTWLHTDETGATVTVIGKAANRPPNPK